MLCSNRMGSNLCPHTRSITSYLIVPIIKSKSASFLCLSQAPAPSLVTVQRPGNHMAGNSCPQMDQLDFLKHKHLNGRQTGAEIAVYLHFRGRPPSAFSSTWCRGVPGASPIPNFQVLSYAKLLPHPSLKSHSCFLT